MLKIREMKELSVSLNLEEWQQNICSNFLPMNSMIFCLNFLLFCDIFLRLSWKKIIALI